MKRYAILLLALCSALTLTLAGCGGGGGGGGGGAFEANPTFSATAPLAQVDPVAPATFSTAVAINDSPAAPTDDAVGASQPAGLATTLQAVAWTVTPGTGTTAPISTATPLQVPIANGPYSRANGINNGTAADPADIVGEMELTGVIVPAFWADMNTPAVALPLGTNVSGAAYGVDNDGVIVGETIAVAGGPSAAVFWDDELALPTPLPTTGTSSSAYAVNNNATVPEVVGEMTDLAGTHAVVWRVTNLGTATVPPTIIEIVLPGSTTPFLNGNAAVALSINNAGTVTGEMEDDLGFVHAVRWIKGTGTTYTVQDLGKGSAQGINNSGRTVGQDDLGDGKAWRATAPLTSFPIGTEAPADTSLGCAINTNSRVVGVKNDQAFFARP